MSTVNNTYSRILTKSKKAMISAFTDEDAITIELQAGDCFIGKLPSDEDKVVVPTIA
jgi:hypothetical protein